MAEPVVVPANCSTPPKALNISNFSITFFGNAASDARYFVCTGKSPIYLSTCPIYGQTTLINGFPSRGVVPASGVGGDRGVRVGWGGVRGGEWSVAGGGPPRDPPPRHLLDLLLGGVWLGVDLPQGGHRPQHHLACECAGPRSPTRPPSSHLPHHPWLLPPRHLHCKG